jgi:hypothetical protein
MCLVRALSGSAVARIPATKAFGGAPRVAKFNLQDGERRIRRRGTAGLVAP